MDLGDGLGGSPFGNWFCFVTPLGSEQARISRPQRLKSPSLALAGTTEVAPYPSAPRLEAELHC
jgi:hypothetical protein